MGEKGKKEKRHTRLCAWDFVCFPTPFFSPNPNFRVRLAATFLKFAHRSPQPPATFLFGWCPSQTHNLMMTAMMTRQRSSNQAE